MLEGCGVFYNNIAENFAVKGYIGFFELIYEDTVGHVLLLNSFTDTDNPEAAEISFAELTSMKGVLTGVQSRFMSDSDKPASGTPVSFGKTLEFFMFSS